MKVLVTIEICDVPRDCLRATLFKNAKTRRESLRQALLAVIHEDDVTDAVEWLQTNVLTVRGGRQ